MAPTRLVPPARLLRRAEFLAAAGRGAKAPMPGLVLQLLDRGDDGPVRVGFTVTKKVGNAVIRNRTKRRLREAVRLSLDHEAHRGLDLVVIGRDKTAKRDFPALVEDLRAAIARARKVATRPAKVAAAEPAL